MLITSIYCAHNMGAHCACSSRSPLFPRLKLFHVLVVYTCRLRLLRLRATHASLDTLLLLLAPLRLVFPLPFFRFLSFARPFFYSYCSCTANSIIVNANFCPIPNPIPLRMFCFSIEDSRRTFSVSAFYLLLIYATLARSRHTPSRLPAP